MYGIFDLLANIGIYTHGRTKEITYNNKARKKALKENKDVYYDSSMRERLTDTNEIVFTETKLIDGIPQKVITNSRGEIVRNLTHERMNWIEELKYPRYREFEQVNPECFKTVYIDSENGGWYLGDRKNGTGSAKKTPTYIDRETGDILIKRSFFGKFNVFYRLKDQKYLRMVDETSVTFNDIIGYYNKHKIGKSGMSSLYGLYLKIIEYYNINSYEDFINVLNDSEKVIVENHDKQGNYYNCFSVDLLYNNYIIGDNVSGFKTYQWV